MQKKTKRDSFFWLRHFGDNEEFSPSSDQIVNSFSRKLRLGNRPLLAEELKGILRLVKENSNGEDLPEFTKSDLSALYERLEAEYESN